MITPPIACPSIKISTYTSPATFRNQILAGKTLHGASLTDGALNPVDPVAAAMTFASFGFNHARFHHGEWQDVGQMVYFADQLHLRGVRFSVGLADKLGEKYPSGIEGFKRDLLDQVPEAEDLYVSNIIRMGPLLRHKGCFMCCLSNETAHLKWDGRYAPEKAQRFWDKWSPVVRDMNPNLLLTDCPDGTDQFDTFSLVARNYDVCTLHFYNGDGNANGTADYIREGWNWKVVNSYHDWTGRKPLFINEFGSYDSNPNQGRNTTFVLLECLRRRYSATHFSFGSNEGCWSGEGGDKFTICNSPIRRNLALLGAYLNKYGVKDGEAYWNGDRDQRDGKYRYVCPNVFADENHVKIRVSSTKTLVWGLDKNQSWQWLNRTVTPEGPFVVAEVK